MYAENDSVRTLIAGSACVAMILFLLAFSVLRAPDSGASVASARPEPVEFDAAGELIGEVVVKAMVIRGKPVWETNRQGTIRVTRGGRSHGIAIGEKLQASDGIGTIAPGCSVRLSFSQGGARAHFNVTGRRENDKGFYLHVLGSKDGKLYVEIYRGVGSYEEGTSVVFMPHEQPLDASDSGAISIAPFG